MSGVSSPGAHDRHQRNDPLADLVAVGVEGRHGGVELAGQPAVRRQVAGDPDLDAPGAVAGDGFQPSICWCSYSLLLNSAPRSHNFSWQKHKCDLKLQFQVHQWS